MGVVPDGPDGEAARGLIARARQLRQAAGIPLPAMADKVGVARSTLSALERNPRPYQR